MVPPNADRAAHAAPPQNSRLVVFTVIMRILYQNGPVAVLVGANAADFAGRLKFLHLAGNPSRRYLKKIGKFHFRNEWICPHILLYLLRQRI